MQVDSPATRVAPRSGIAVPRLRAQATSFAHVGWSPGTLLTIGLAVILTGTPILLHLTGQWLGIASAIVLASFVAIFAAPAVPIALLFSYLFQNAFVSLVSPQIETMEQFNAMRAYNFVLTAAAWIVFAASYWTARARFDRDFRALIDVTTAVLVVIGVYFVVGVAANPGAAVIYLRNIVLPLLLFQIFAVVAYCHRLSMTAPLTVLAAVALLYGYLEFLAHEELFPLVNADSYFAWRTKQERDSGVWLKELHETGRVIRSYVDTMAVDFLNTPMLADLGMRLNRIVGPNFHSISYAYALAFFSIVLFAIGRWWYPLLALPLLFVVGSKGALIMTILVTVGIAALPRLRAPVWIFAAILLLYIAAGIAIGIQGQDYHVIGFIGGLKGFLVNPIGRGIGVGGNLSLDMTGIDWSRSQYLGQTDIAVESAVGVLLYQIGVFAFAVFAVVGWIAMKLWRWYRRSGSRLYAMGCFALLTVLANGIFQEEALFAPLALGIVLAFAGLLVGRAHRMSAKSPELRRRNATSR